MTEHRRAWAHWTTWGALIAATVAAALLILLAYTGPQRPITETDFSGMAVFVTRLAAGVFMLVLAASCSVQAGLYLPQRSSLRRGLPVAAVLDLLVLIGVVAETACVLSVGFGDVGYLPTAILAGGAGIALLSAIRFVIVVTGGVVELRDRRRERRAV